MEGRILQTAERPINLGVNHETEIFLILINHILYLLNLCVLFNIFITESLILFQFAL